MQRVSCQVFSSVSVCHIHNFNNCHITVYTACVMICYSRVNVEKVKVPLFTQFLYIGKETESVTLS